MADKGFLLVTMQPPPAFEEEFNAWYDTEHLPERLAVPGFETALRFVCISGHPRYLAMYDLARPASARLARVPEGCVRQLQPVDVAGIAARARLSSLRPADLPGQRHHRQCVARRAPALSQSAGERGRRDRQRHACEFREAPETVQVRVFAFEDRGSTDFLGFVEQRAPGLAALDLKPFGAHAAAIDLANIYAPY